jgi:hypothetical protein
MSGLVIRHAETHDAEGIARVCAAGWRDTYHGIKEPARIEAVIAEYYAPERIRREIAAPEGWDGWIVAVEDDTVIGAGGGGMTEPGVCEIFVLYLDPMRRGAGGRPCFSSAHATTRAPMTRPPRHRLCFCR